MRYFKVNNVNCQNCAKTIKNALLDDFGEVDIDVDKKILSVEIKDEDIKKLYALMLDLGFEVIQEVK